MKQIHAEDHEYGDEVDAIYVLPYYVVEIQDHHQRVGFAKDVRVKIPTEKADGLLTLQPSAGDVIMGSRQAEFQLLSGGGCRVHVRGDIGGGNGKVVMGESDHNLGPQGDLAEILSRYVTSDGFIRDLDDYHPVVVKTISDFDTKEEYAEAAGLVEATT